MPSSPVPWDTQAVKVLDLIAAGTGLRDQAAGEAGYDPVTVATTADDHKACHPGATPIRVHITGTVAPAGSSTRSCSTPTPPERAGARLDQPRVAANQIAVRFQIPA
jgi:hypothetical protein